MSDLHVLEKSREQMAESIGARIALRNGPSPLLLSAREAARQSVAATALARAADGDQRIEWVAVAKAYADVAAALVRLAA